MASPMRFAAPTALEYFSTLVADDASQSIWRISWKGVDPE